MALPSASSETQTETSSFEEQLKRKLWITKGARYNAARRLHSRHVWSLRALSWLSAYTIIVSIIQLSVPEEALDVSPAILQLSTLVFSLVLLVISLLEASQNYQTRSEHLHDCANQISRAYDELLLSVQSGVEPNRFFEISNEYHQIIQECRDNHEPIDYALFKAQNRRDFSESRFSSWSTKFKAWVVTKAVYQALIFGLPLVAILVWILVTR